MSLENSKYKIFKLNFKKKSITVLKFNPKYTGFTSWMKLIDFPVYFFSLLLFFLRFRSITLLFNLIHEDISSKIIKKDIAEHELDIIRNNSKNILHIYSWTRGHTSTPWTYS